MKQKFWLGSIAVLCGLALGGPAAHAASPETSDSAPSLESQLTYQQGKVTLKDGVAELNLGPQFRYLDPDLTQRVITEGWGNPPGEKTLGMLVPAGVSPLADEGWGVLITYEEDGYVDDKGAEKIDYDDLLSTMKKGTKEDNKARQKAGYPAIDLIGWAETPHYDKASHKLYWAKDLKLATAQVHSLNYNVRVLGRRGVLVLNAVAGMELLPNVRTSMQQLLPMVEFNPGHRYADFLPGKDKVAEYGIGALVLGTLAAKTGLFKVLIAGILAAKKFVLIGLVALGTWLKKIFGKKKEEQMSGFEPPPPPTVG